MRIALSIVIVMLFTASMVQAETVIINLPSIKSVTLPTGWNEMKQLDSMCKAFFDNKFSALTIKYSAGEQYKHENKALKEIVSKTPHILDSAERGSVTETALFRCSKKTELKTIVSNGQKVVCIKEPFYSVAYSMPVGGQKCDTAPTTCYMMFKPLENGYLSVEYSGSEVDDKSWDTLLRSIVWR